MISIENTEENRNALKGHYEIAGIQSLPYINFHSMGNNFAFDSGDLVRLRALLNPTYRSILNTPENRRLLIEAGMLREGQHKNAKIISFDKDNHAYRSVSVHSGIKMVKIWELIGKVQIEEF